MSVVFLKLGLVVVLLMAFALILVLRQRVDNFFSNKAGRWFWLVWIGFRLVPFIVIYRVVDYQATSDLLGFYYGAVAARGGLLVYRDFFSVYAPLYAYITAIPTVFWDDARSIIVLMILVEGIALWGTYRLYQLSLTTVLMYLLLPTSLLFCVVGGQEDVWMWGFGLLTFWVMRWRRNESAFTVGMILGLAMIVTKALFILFIPIFFWWMRDKLRLILGMAVVGLPVVIGLYLVSGWAFLMPVQLAQDPLSPNIWSVLHPWVGSFLDRIPPKLFNYIALVGVFVITSVYILRLKRLEGQPASERSMVAYSQLLPRAWIMVFCLIMLLVPSAYAVYTFGFMLPLVTTRDWNRGRLLIVLLILNLLSTVQPSLWWRLGQHFYSLQDLSYWPYLVEYTLQAGIVACLFYFVTSLWRSSAIEAQPSNIRMISLADVQVGSKPVEDSE